MGNNNASSDGFAQPINKGCCERQSLFITNPNTDPSDITCAICFTIFSSPRVMKCKHVFCEECIHTWGSRSSATCPFCRTELKRTRGNFGRVDKKTQKKLEKLSLKCRNCCWQGSHCTYVTTFLTNPYLDDEQLPQEKNSEPVEHESQEQIILEEKNENPEVQKTAAKQLDQGQLQEKKEKNEQTTNKAFDLFISAFLNMDRREESGQDPMNFEVLDYPQ